MYYQCISEVMRHCINQILYVCLSVYLSCRVCLGGQLVPSFLPPFLPCSPSSLGRRISGYSHNVAYKGSGVVPYRLVEAFKAREESLQLGFRNPIGSPIGNPIGNPIGSAIGNGV